MGESMQKSLILFAAISVGLISTAAADWSVNVNEDEMTGEVQAFALRQKLLRQGLYVSLMQG